MRWLFVSYKASKRRGVPALIQMSGNEIVLEGSASSQRFRKALGERFRASDISIRLLNGICQCSVLALGGLGWMDLNSSYAVSVGEEGVLPDRFVQADHAPEGNERLHQ
jgi:hypothetical protein